MTDLILDPVLAERLPLLAGVPPLGMAPPTAEEMARFLAFSASVDGYQAPQVRVTPAIAPGPHGDIPVRVYEPVDAALRDVTHGLVWAHGGAFMFGDLDMPESDVVARELVHRAGITVITVDYRLCRGGVHFPIPHDDVHAAYMWASGPDGPLGAGASWALGGASAGGNLAAGVAQRLRDEGTSEPYALVLAYPVAHDPVPPLSVECEAAMSNLPIALRFPAPATAFVNRAYLGDHPSTTPYAFPGLGVLEGLPRTLVMLCEYDDLRASGERLAHDLSEAGVTVVVELVRGVVHGHLNTPGLSAALSSLRLMTEFLSDDAVMLPSPTSTDL